MPLQSIEDRIDVKMRQHDLAPAAQQVRQCIESRAMRQRAGVQIGVALVQCIDISVIAMAHEEQIAVAQHRAFPPPGRSARVKQPCAVGSGRIHRTHRLAPFQQPCVAAAAGRDDLRHGLDRLLERREGVREARCGNEQPGAGIARNVLDLPDMQSGIDRHRAEPRRPAREHHLQKFGAILHAQNDPVAGFEATARETTGETRDAAGELAVAPAVVTVADGRRLRLPTGDIE